MTSREGWSARRAREQGRGEAVRTVASDVGVMLLVPAALSVTGLVVAVLAREWFAVPGFVGVAAVAGGAGQALRRLSGPPSAGSTRQSLIAVALGWLLVAVIAAVPFLVAARLGHAVGGDVGSADVFADPWSALFEGMSGFTSTGLTMVDAESELPHALQWWRSILEWTGGAGVVVFALAITQGEGGYDLYKAEGRSRRLRADAHVTARRIWRILLAVTAGSVLLLLAAGAHPWVALNHGLTGISTGGMVITDDSFAGTSAAVRLAGIVIMTAGALSYGSLLLLLDCDLAGFVRLTQVRALGIALAVGAAVVLGVQQFRGGEGGPLDAVFLWVSALTTSGFSTADVAPLPVATVLLLLAAMFVGGSAGSTSGGIKLRRAVWLGRALLRSPALVESSSPDGRRWRTDGHDMPPDAGRRAVVAAAALVAAYAVTLAIGTLLLSLSTDGTLRQVLFDATSALNTVGLTSGLTTSDLPWHAKAELMMLMWMGRLEVLAVAVLLAAPVAKGLRLVAGSGRSGRRAESPPES